MMKIYRYISLVFLLALMLLKFGSLSAMASEIATTAEAAMTIKPSKVILKEGGFIHYRITLKEPTWLGGWLYLFEHHNPVHGSNAKAGVDYQLIGPWPSEYGFENTGITFSHKTVTPRGTRYVYRIKPLTKEIELAIEALNDDDYEEDFHEYYHIKLGFVYDYRNGNQIKRVQQRLFNSSYILSNAIQDRTHPPYD
jgi:hypothetical protein